MATKTKPADLQVGDEAPAFRAVDEAGTEHSLAQYKGKTVVLYFYPKDSTPGCTIEACDFRDSLSAFKRKGAVVLGVSADSAKAHQNFINKQKLTFPLLVDEDKKIIKSYGVWGKKSLYGREFEGIIRSTFVIGPDARIKELYRKVSVNGHVKDVLEKI